MPSTSTTRWTTSRTWAATTWAGCGITSRSCSSADRGNGRTRPARSTRRGASARCSTRRASPARSTSGATTSRTTGRRGDARSRIICPGSHERGGLQLMAEHLIGLLIGTEDDWPRAFEALVARLGPVDGHELRTERIVNEPLDLRSRPRYSLVIDRLAWWYDLPRAWLKKVALMDDVYLLNNPFTFQAMEKHSAYCALMRLGIRVPETWLIPHKVPPDGGQWIGVSRVGSPDELRAHYDDSGERMMHLQTALEGFDVFVRSLSIGAETTAMWFDPSRPMYDRYQVRHDFLTPELGDEILTISRLVNAFFRWEFNSCETIVKDGVAYPIDYANASPDVALTSLHYYFPWAITALV